MNSGSSEDSKTCAVPGCALPISDVGHLCDSHRLPGMVARVNNRTFVIMAWAAKHGDESAIIFLNDYAIGNLFGGRAGFEKRLGEQGFTGVHLIETQEELQSAKRHANDNKKMGDWGGPWKTEYPWEVVSEEGECK
jgi:hypothetical protein